MSDIAYAFLNSFINAAPFVFIVIIFVSVFRAPFSRFISRNLLDSGKDRYNSGSENKKEDGGSQSKIIIEEELKRQIHKILLNESGKEYFDSYKESVSNLINERQKELTDYALKNLLSEDKIEETITESLHSTVEKTTNRLIRESDKFKTLEKTTTEKLNLIKISSFLEHLEKEYDATRSTKALMSNMFILVNVFYFLGLIGFLISGVAIIIAPPIYFALSFSYIGLGAFVVYMIKFCNARSLTLLSLREDFLKREQISSMATKMVDLGTNEHHVALLQLMNSSIATKEQKINHPYEMLLYGIKDSNIMFKGGKFEIKKEASGNSKP
ncbi:hypothetical protein [Pectobacterium brasiliense]|uniref:hypothetical protein n=1 Tax=Pectobacterium brasiliense TaxID=180957 RepID=UPI001969875A|nr:hypothetical protein [Pectobacterium brasiliense]MBN3143739.1 hypothetical protein [Pectobacterium brasiliense]